MVGATIPPMGGDSSSPVADKQVVTSFGESFISISGTQNTLDGRLFGPDVPGETASGSFVGGSTQNGWFGPSITPNVPIFGLTIGELNGLTPGTNYGFRIRDIDATETILFSDIDPANLPVTVRPGLFEVGREYAVEVDIPGESTDEFGSDTTTALSKTSGWCVNDITPRVAASGSVVVEFDAPSDVFGWDVATFSRTLPGSSAADVFVEDSSGTEVAGPISRGGRLPVDPDENPRFRIDFQVGDIGDVPSLDSLARRWKL